LQQVRLNTWKNAPEMATYFWFRVRGRYDPLVFGIAGRRVAEAVVALFALLGFAFVPLGQKTAFEHSVAVFTTPAAIGAFHELTGAALRLKDRIAESLAPALPKPEHQPKPELPKLAPPPSKRP
jgi:hypothetical protein